jgi:hypothetical protein
MLAGLWLTLLPAVPPPSPTPADVPRLIAQIKASFGTKSSSAVDALAHIGAPAVPALIEVLKDRTLPDIGNVLQPARNQAVMALERMGPSAGEAVPILLEVLRDRKDDPSVRGMAASALASIGESTDEVVPSLIDMLDEPEMAKNGWGWYALRALSTLAVRHPASRPALERVLPDLRRLHRQWGGSMGFAEMFRVLEPPSAERRGEEDAIREIVIRKTIGHGADTWCLGGSVSDLVFERLKDLKVTRTIAECRIPGSEEGSAPDLINWRHRTLDVRGIDWLSATRVHAETSACFGYDPCHTTEYQLERRGGQWIILSENRPPAM